MICHYIYTEDGLKVLIPGCDAVAFSGDIELCTCSSRLTSQRFEKDRYNHEVDELRKDIESLRESNEYLVGVIERMRRKLAKQTKPIKSDQPTNEHTDNDKDIQI